MLNNQAIEKQDLHFAGDLQVNSIFLTIQGEGPFVGQPAVFIRLAGCNLQCPQCDTEYTKRSTMNYFEIGMRVNQLLQGTPANELVVITGGEPFRQNIGPLVKFLLEKHFTVQIETNGTLYQELPYENKRLFIVCSPKTGVINKQLQPYIGALKYVVNSKDVDSSDGLPNHALGHPCKKLARPNDLFVPIYIQAADEKDDIKNFLNLQAAKKSAMKNGYILGVQLHKIIGEE